MSNWYLPVPTKHEFEGYEFAPGKVVGQRAFNIGADQRSLRSVHVSHTWEDGVNHCYCAVLDKKGVCTPYHGCGFWAYHQGSTYPGGAVQGVIEGWGKVTIGTLGFRAEYAKIVAVHIPGYSDKMKEFRRERRSELLRPWKWMSWTGAMIVATAVFQYGWLVYSILYSEWLSILVAGIAMVCTSAAAYFSCLLEFRRWMTKLNLFQSNSPYISPQTIDRLRKQYPSVKFYGTRKEMLAAHPIDPEARQNAYKVGTDGSKDSEEGRR